MCVGNDVRLQERHGLFDIIKIQELHSPDTFERVPECLW